jgi:hypothetical protein
MGSHDLTSDYGAQRASLKGLGASGPKGLEIILFCNLICQFGGACVCHIYDQFTDM